MKRTLAILLVAVMAFACMPAFADEQPITLAVIGPMTGAAAVYGNAVQYGATIAANEINEAAGKTVVKLIIEDDTHDAERALSAYGHALDNDAQAIIGTVTTTPCIAVSAQAYKERVFMLTPSASSSAVTAGKDNCYQLCFTDPAQGTLAAQYIIANQLGSTIGIIYNISDPYSVGIYQTFVDECAARGVTIAATEAFIEGAVDYSVQVNAMKSAGCDIVFLPMYYTPASQILIQANSVGYSPKFFGVDGMDGILTIDGFDPAMAEGVLLLTPFAADATDDLTVNFVTKYVAAYGETPNQFAADAYDCVYAMVAAFEAAGLDGTVPAEDCCDALIAVFSGDFEITGVTGTMTWSASGEVTKSPNAVIIKDGAYVSPENY